MSVLSTFWIHLVKYILVISIPQELLHGLRMSIVCKPPFAVMIDCLSPNLVWCAEPWILVKC